MAKAPSTDLGGFFNSMPKTYKKALPKKVMRQSEKTRFVAGLALSRLFRDNACSVEQLEQDAAGRVSGRLSLTLGAGVGGKGGMQIIRNGTDLVLCRDNVFNLVEHLQRDGLERWLNEAGVALAEFSKWLETLPSI